MRSLFIREVTLLGGLVLAAILLLPPLIYVTGGLTLGPYDARNGLLNLTGHILGDLFTGHVWALALILSPYVLVTLLRLMILPFRR